MDIRPTQVASASRKTAFKTLPRSCGRLLLAAAVWLAACDDDVGAPEEVNRPPTSRTMPALEIIQGETATVDVSAYFSDPDGEALAYGAESSNTGVAQASVTASTMTVLAVARGDAVVTVTATDPGGLTAMLGVDVTVPNRAPASIGSITTRTVAVGDTSTIDLSPYFTDIDGDALSYSGTSSDLGVASASVSGEALTITGTGPGTASVEITASDDGGASASLTMKVRVGSATRFEDRFDDEESLERWQAHHADLLVSDGLLSVIGATPNVAGMAIHTLETPVASWELGVRVGREDDDGLPSIVVFVDDTTFSAYRMDVGNFLPIRPQTNVTNYRLLVYDAGRGRWLPVSGTSGLSDEIHTEEGELSAITLAVQNGRIRGGAGDSTLFDFTVDSVPWLVGASTDAVEVGLVIIDLEPDNTAIFDQVILDGIAVEAASR